MSKKLYRLANRFETKLALSQYNAYSKVVHIALMASELLGKMNDFISSLEDKDIYEPADPQEEKAKMAKARHLINRLYTMSNRFVTDVETTGVSQDMAAQYKEKLQSMTGQLKALPSPSRNEHHVYLAGLEGALREFMPAMVTAPASQKAAPPSEPSAGFAEKQEEVTLPQKAYDIVDRLVEQNYSSPDPRWPG